MNKKRKEQINKLAEQLESLKEELDSILEEEQEYYDNIPENLQGGERAEKSDEAISALEDATSYLGDCFDSLTDI